MRLDKVEELAVYQKALDLSAEILPFSRGAGCTLTGGFAIN
jgi:hypothetical protein